MEKKKTMMTTIILTVILVVLCIIITTLLVVNLLKDKGVIASSESKEVLAQVDKYFNSKDRVVIYYASSECQFCELETPILEELAEDYDIDYYYVDSTKLSKGQKKEITDKLDIEGKTPTTVVVEDGKVIDTQVGYVDGKDYVEFFKNAEVVPEDAIYGAEEYITYIDYTQYEKLISSKGTNVIVIGQTTCPHCIAIKPALNSVAEDYNITINYLNLTELTDDESSSFFESLTTLEYNDEKYVSEGSIGTPLVILVKNGKITNYFSGERTTSQLVREFKKFGLIS